MAIPVKLTEDQFQTFVEPYLSRAKRGYVCKIPRYKLFNYLLQVLYTGCQWPALQASIDLDGTGEPELSFQAVYYHFRKWSRDGSLQRVFESSVRLLLPDLDLSELNLDGTHTLAKKGGESVAYQGRKKGKTSNILPVTNRHGFILTTTDIIAGNHNDQFELTKNLKAIFANVRRLGLKVAGAVFNMDMGFDTKSARKVCFNRQVKPNIPENRRNRVRTKPGPKRFFDSVRYANRFCIERTFAWVDKFKRLLIRFERKDVYFKGWHFLAFFLINLRHVLAPKV